jgi:hypothetical protein
MSHFTQTLKQLAGGVLLSLAAAQSVQAVTVDLLVTYDDATNRHFNGQVDAAMQNWVSQINGIYRNSQIDVQLRLAGTMYYNIGGADMGQVLGAIRVDGNIARKRDEVGADLVTQLHSTGNCGLGYVAVSRDWAFNVVGPGCGAQVMAHELGHNMGLSHSRKQGDQGGARFRYGLGHGVDGAFATTMAYPGVFNTNWVPSFSNPRNWCNGMPCGVSAGQSNEADATSAINNVRNELAGFKPERQATAYVLKNQNSGKCLDVAGWSGSNGAPLLQWDCHRGNNQRFRVLDGGNGFWKLQNVHSGKCVDVSGVSTANGAIIHQWDCHNGDNQKIKAANIGGNLYHMAFKHSGICMDVNGWGKGNGEKIIQWSCHAGENQRFYFEQAQ